MLFGPGRKREKEIAAQLEKEGISQGFWSRVYRQFRSNRLALWSLRFLYVLLFIAFFSNFIANERPWYCKIEDKTYFPVFWQYGDALGIHKTEARFYNFDWRGYEEYQGVWFAPIPYSANKIDEMNMGFNGPFDKQNVKSRRFWHWLGTDEVGRDVAAGMVTGTRTAILVGVVAMSIAALIGIFLGAIAGYFGDNRFKVSRIRLFLNILGIGLAIFYGFKVREFALAEGQFGVEFLKGVGISLIFMTAMNGLASLLERFPALGMKVVLPLDILVMRLIEIINSIPGLLLILSVVGLINKPSIFYVMVIIGLIGWTTIARFVRSELLRIRKMEYIEAAQALGYSEWRIILRHALPNALTPVLITLAFGMASAILLEAFLSFLGIGLPADQVTWGSLLNSARSGISAWWLAIFPGFAIFFTVTILNLIGEGLTDAIDPKRT